MVPLIPQVDDGTTDPHLPSRVGVTALVLVPRPDVLPWLLYIHVYLEYPYLFVFLVCHWLYNQILFCYLFLQKVEYITLYKMFKPLYLWLII